MTPWGKVLSIVAILCLGAQVRLALAEAFGSIGDPWKGLGLLAVMGLLVVIVVGAKNAS